MAVRNLEAVQQLSGAAVKAESRAGRIGPISLGAKQTGERRAGKPHAAFDVAETGNVAWSKCCDTRRRKGELTGNTNIDLNRRASLRPYQAGRRTGSSSRTRAAPQPYAKLPKTGARNNGKLVRAQRARPNSGID